MRGRGGALIVAAAALAACGRMPHRGPHDGSDFRITLQGGPDSGTYVVHWPDLTCSYGIAGAGAWGNQYHDDTARAGLTSVQLIVPNAKQSARRASAFNLTVSIGALGHGARDYRIETRPGYARLGSGTVAIDDRDSTATVTIHAVTAERVGIDGVIECRAVGRA